MTVTYETKKTNNHKIERERDFFFNYLSYFNLDKKTKNQFIYENNIEKYII